MKTGIILNEVMQLSFIITGSFYENQMNFELIFKWAGNVAERYTTCLKHVRPWI